MVLPGGGAADWHHYIMLSHKRFPAHPSYPLTSLDAGAADVRDGHAPDADIGERRRHLFHAPGPDESLAETWDRATGLPGVPSMH